MAARRLLGTGIAAFVFVLVACKHHTPGGEIDADPGAQVDAECNDLSCFIVDCGSKGLPPTSISGTVYAPNGTLPLYGVTVYVPASDPGPLPDGVQCGNCSVALPGGALTQTKTDVAGNFVLEHVPATSEVPIVIQSGKWRRQITIPAIAACQDLSIPKAETTLPRNKSEGDIPKIAITTGNADALECLVRKMGIDDAEFTTDAGDGRVHMFHGTGVNKFAATHPGGVQNFSTATSLWGTTAKLSDYDIVMFSCESSQNAGTKPLSALEAVRDYADLGGRVFLSHWHNIWVSGQQNNPSNGIPDWQSIGTWDFGASQTPANNTASIDLAVTKGVEFADWMMNVGGSTTYTQVPIAGTRYTLQSNDPTKSDRRVYLDFPTVAQGRGSVQDLEFSTPQDVPAANRCGKVVFSDMHVASGSSSPSNGSFPSSCSTADLTPQEKALAFIFFDITSCVGVIQ